MILAGRGNVAARCVSSSRVQNEYGCNFSQIVSLIYNPKNSVKSQMTKAIFDEKLDIQEQEAEDAAKDSDGFERSGSDSENEEEEIGFTANESLCDTPTREEETNSIVTMTEEDGNEKVLSSDIDAADYHQIFTTNTKEVIAKLAVIFKADVKAYWSRNKWDKMKESQRASCHAAWCKLTSEEQFSMIQDIETSKPKAAGVQSTEVAPFSTQNTNKDDKARLIHMLNSPAFSSKFTSAHQVMNRAELDDKACHGEHWNDLAASFNDYEGEK